MNVGMTGPVAAYGVQANEATRAYLDDVNKNGGVNGHQIMLKTVDSKEETSTATSNAVKLITQDHALAILGSTLSNSCAAQVPVATQNKVSLLCTNVDPKDVFPPKQYVFATGAPEVNDVAAMVELTKRLATSGHNVRVAVVHGDVSGSVRFEQEAASQIEKEGWTLATNQTVALGVSDTTTQAAKVAAAKPDIVWISILSSLQPQFFQQLRSAGSNAPVVSTMNTGSYISLKTISDPSYYINSGTAFITPDTTGAGARQYVADMAAVGVKTAKELNGASSRPNAYLAAVALIEAIKKCGDDCTGEVVAKNLESVSLSMEGLSDHFAYSPDSHVPVSGYDAWHWDNGAPAIYVKDLPATGGLG